MSATGVQQLAAFVVVAVTIIGSATFLAAQHAIDAQAYVALVGVLGGGIVGILNPVPPVAAPRSEP